MQSSRARGFSLIELLVVVAIIALVAGIAIPRFIGARRSANESSAIATLRAVLTCQMQSQATNSIDTDDDGLAEFCYFGELGGNVPARVSAAGVPTAGTVGVDELTPSPLLQSLSNVRNGVVTHSGYVFQMWLPANGAPPPIAGIAEDPNGGKTVGPFPEPTAGEQYFACYAWPQNAGISGLRCFFINQEGTILETSMRGAGTYSGIGGGPNFDAAFTVAGDMSSRIARGAGAVDGHNWVPVQ